MESICDACDDQSSDEQQQRSSLRHRDRFLAKLQQRPVDRAATTLLPGQQRSKALPRQSSSRPCTQQSAARDPIVSAASSRFDQPSPRRSTQLGGCGHGGASARTEAHHPVHSSVTRTGDPLSRGIKHVLCSPVGVNCWRRGLPTLRPVLGGIFYAVCRDAFSLWGTRAGANESRNRAQNKANSLMGGCGVLGFFLALSFDPSGHAAAAGAELRRARPASGAVIKFCEFKELHSSRNSS